MSAAAVEVSTLCCPRCRADLELDAAGTLVRCGGCARTFPVAAGVLPVLVADPEHFLARTAIRLRQTARALETDALELAAAAWTTTQPELWVRCTRCLERRRALLEELIGEIVSSTSAASLVEAGAGPESQDDPLLSWSYLDADAYLLRDWSGSPATEAEVGAIEEAVGPLLSTARPHGLAVVLGAGGGRLAWDLQERFDSVLAVDSSVPMGLAYHRIVHGGLTVGSIETSNVRSRADVVWEAELSTRVSGVPRDGPSGAVRYCVADGTALPLGDGQADVVVSVYFTDVVPLPLLLREVARVLRPGGTFVHVGPLKRHSERRWELVLTPDDVLEELGRRGFTVRERGWVSLPHRSRPGRLEQTRYDSWTLAATAPADLRRIDEETVLAFCRRSVVSTRAWLGGNGEAPTVTLEIPGVETSAVSPDVIQVLRRIDGRRSVAELARSLAGDGFELDGEAREALLALLEQYRAEGLLEVLGPTDA